MYAIERSGKGMESIMENKESNNDEIVKKIADNARKALKIIESNKNNNGENSKKQKQIFLKK